MPFLQESSGVAVNGGTLIDVHGSHHNINVSAGDKKKWEGIELLLELCVPEAIHDSGARDDLGCHPGTREKYIRSITSWGKGEPNSNSEKRAFLMTGPAGVGKSAIARTCANNIEASGKLGATFFFYRPEGWNDPKKFIPTLVYQLTTRSTPYRDCVDAIILKDRLVLQKAMDVQFRELLIKPLLKLNDDGHAAIRHLYSVLEVVKSSSGEPMLLKLYHKSFLDFLLDKRRSQQYSLESPDAPRHCLKTLVQTMANVANTIGENDKEHLTMVLFFVMVRKHEGLLEEDILRQASRVNWGQWNRLDIVVYVLGVAELVQKIPKGWRRRIIRPSRDGLSGIYSQILANISPKRFEASAYIIGNGDKKALAVRPCPGDNPSSRNRTLYMGWEKHYLNCRIFSILGLVTLLAVVDELLFLCSLFYPAFNDPSPCSFLASKYHSYIALSIIPPTTTPLLHNPNPTKPYNVPYLIFASVILGSSIFWEMMWLMRCYHTRGFRYRTFYHDRLRHNSESFGMGRIIFMMVEIGLPIATILWEVVDVISVFEGNCQQWTDLFGWVKKWTHWS